MPANSLFHCGQEWKAGSKFCGTCGVPFVTEPAPATSAVSGTRWSRITGEIARRLDVADLKALLSKNLDVEEGTRGLMLQHGRCVETLTPGRYTLETIPQRLKSLITGHAFSAVVMDVSVQRFEIVSSGLFTRDNQPVDARARLAFSVTDPEAFFREVVKGANRVSLNDVADLFRPMSVSVLKAMVVDSTLGELAAENELRERLHDDLERRLKSDFAKMGLTFWSVDTVEFDCPNHRLIQREEAQIDFSEARQKLRERQRRVTQQLEAEAIDDQIAKIKSEQELMEFLSKTRANADEERKQREYRGRVLDLARQKDWEGMWDSFAVLKDNLAAKREFLKKQLEWEHQRDLESLQHQYEKQRLLHQHELDGMELTRKLSLEQAEYDLRRRRSLQELETQRAQELDQARHDDQIAGIRLKTKTDQDKAVLDSQKERAALALDLYSRQQSVDREGLQFQQQLERDRLDSESKRQKEDADAAHRRDQERLQLLNVSKNEALLVVADSEQGKLLADQMRLQAMQNMTSDQIAAIHAANSPGLAQALIEKFKADAAATTQAGAMTNEFYERMLAQQAEFTRQLQATSMRSLGIVQQMNEVSLTTQRDTAVAAAGGGVVPALVAGLTGKNQASPVVASPTVRFCTRCRKSLTVNQSFCDACGEKQG